MKKIIVFLLTAVLCLATLSIGMTAAREPGTPYGTVYKIEKFTPKVDGVRDAEYLYSDKVVLRDNGPEFATGEIYYLWDDDALYFYVDIHDTTGEMAEEGVDHESDCIEMLFSLYNFDVNAETITAKQASDIGDAQFRVFRTKDLSYCETIVDNGIKYADGSHGGFGKWVYDNTDIENHDPEKDACHIIHYNDEDGYRFEGFVKWSPDLKGETEAYPEATIKTDVIVGLGIQVNDDINADNTRDKKCYADNSGPNEMSMSSNRATCGMFQLVDNGIVVEEPETTPAVTEPETPAATEPETPAATEPEVTPDVPGTADPSVIFALLTVVSAGGFTVFAAKKAKKD